VQDCAIKRGKRRTRNKPALGEQLHIRVLDWVWTSQFLLRFLSRQQKICCRVSRSRFGITSLCGIERNKKVETKPDRILQNLCYHTVKSAKQEQGVTEHGHLLLCYSIVFSRTSISRAPTDITSKNGWASEYPSHREWLDGSVSHGLWNVAKI